MVAPARDGLGTDIAAEVHWVAVVKPFHYMLLCVATSPRAVCSIAMYAG